jgi:hypothetical protein
MKELTLERAKVEAKIAKLEQYLFFYYLESIRGSYNKHKVLKYDHNFIQTIIYIIINLHKILPT